MTERMKNRLAYLKAAQADGLHTICPRCGRNSMKPVLHTNALSRHLENVYICDECGTAEAMLDFMKSPLPLSEWVWFRPRIQPSPFESMAAEQALTQIVSDQAETLKHSFLQAMAQPDDTADIRLDAFERCAGLTELWVQPFVAKFAAADGAVLLRYKLDEHGDTHFAADIIRE